MLPALVGTIASILFHGLLLKNTRLTELIGHLTVTIITGPEGSGYIHGFNYL
jgi:predicted Kef-type K+ transport protein